MAFGPKDVDVIAPVLDRTLRKHQRVEFIKLKGHQCRSVRLSLSAHLPLNHTPPFLLLLLLTPRLTASLKISVQIRLRVWIFPLLVLVLAVAVGRTSYAPPTTTAGDGFVS